MRAAVILDCEFLTAEGALSRMWSGPDDPDPSVVQVGLVRLGLEADFPIRETARLHVVPRDRHGNRCPLDPYFTRLTGVTEAMIDAEGQTLPDALAAVEAFAADTRIWSWGKDELYMMGISCFVAGFPPPIAATRFGNATRLLHKAGMSVADITATRSSGLAARFGLGDPALRAHDALDDARSVALVLQHLLRQGALAPADLA